MCAYQLDQPEDDDDKPMTRNKRKNCTGTECSCVASPHDKPMFGGMQSSRETRIMRMTEPQFSYIGFGWMTILISSITLFVCKSARRCQRTRLNHRNHKNRCSEYTIDCCCHIYYEYWLIWALKTHEHTQSNRTFIFRTRFMI